MAGGVVCYGELLLRLTAPRRELLLQSPRLDVHVGGAEANVAVALARLGHPTAMISTVPDNPLGRAARGELARHDVDVAGVGFGDGRMGLYFLAAGAGLRPSDIIYDRDGSAFARNAAVDWPTILEGAGWLHLSGITAALGPAIAKAALDGIEAARALGVRVSFDCNYRARLWAAWDSDPASTISDFVQRADLLFGSHRDVALLLGTEFHGDGPNRRREAALAAFDAFPNLGAIAAMARQVENVDRHRLSGRVDTLNAGWQTEEVVVPGIIDRIGGGDAFAAGVLHERLIGGDEAAQARSGLALACLKHSLPGDAALFSRDDLAAFGEGGLDVRR